MKKTVLMFLLSVMLLLVTPALAELKVWFLDVGQADAAVVQCDGQLMMIDGGNAADSRFIYSFLRNTLQVSRIDVMISTHPHEDHIGGLSAALNACSVGTVYSPVSNEDTKIWHSFVKQLDRQSLQITVPETGDRFMLGNAAVTFLSVTQPGLSENDRSLVIRLDYQGTSFLFTGDIGFAEESLLLSSGVDLHADVLKVGHHGSATSSSMDFLKAVNPGYAVISVGKGNQFSHPAVSTLSSIQKIGASIVRTDMNGTILFTCDGCQLTCSASPCEPALIVRADCSEARYIANRNTHKLHKADCPSVMDIKESNRVGYSTIEDAQSDGYVGCKRCTPFTSFPSARHGALSAGAY